MKGGRLWLNFEFVDTPMVLSSVRSDLCVKVC